MSERKWEKEKLGVVLILLSLIIVGLAIANIVIFFLAYQAPVQVVNHGTDYESKEEISKRASEIYAEGGDEAVIAYYNDLVESAQDKAQKIEYLKYSVESLDIFCGWGCREEILSYIHEIASLDDKGETTNTMCVYEELYVDTEPTDSCNIIRGSTGL